MGAQFTRGPWSVHSDGQIWSDDHPVAEKITTGPWGDEGVNIFTGETMLVHHWGTVATDEAKANAHLIAAAPELYEYVESSAQNGCATAQALVARAQGPSA